MQFYVQKRGRAESRRISLSRDMLLMMYKVLGGYVAYDV